MAYVNFILVWQAHLLFDDIKLSDLQCRKCCLILVCFVCTRIRRARWMKEDTIENVKIIIIIIIKDNSTSRKMMKKKRKKEKKIIKNIKEGEREEIDDWVCRKFIGINLVRYIRLYFIFRGKRWWKIIWVFFGKTTYVAKM